MTEIVLAGTDFEQILKNPDAHSGKQIAICLDEINRLNEQVREYKLKLQHILIKKMVEDHATKLIYKSLGEEEKTVTLGNGKVDCTVKNLDSVWMDHGGDPSEIGDYKFVPSWSKAKNVKKLGGWQAEIIDKVFVESEKKLKID
jgi:hypothetical protein